MAEHLYTHPVTKNTVTRRDEYAQALGFVPADQAEDDSELKLAELREVARKRGLPVSGNKDELRERIAESDASSNSAGDE